MNIISINIRIFSNIKQSSILMLCVFSFCLCKLCPSVKMSLSCYLKPRFLSVGLQACFCFLGTLICILTMNDHLCFLILYFDWLLKSMLLYYLFFAWVLQLISCQNSLFSKECNYFKYPSFLILYFYFHFSILEQAFIFVFHLSYDPILGLVFHYFIFQPCSFYHFV